MSKKKKIIILSGMVLLLAITAVFNFMLTPDASETPVVSTGTFFSNYRTERTTMRNEEMLILDSIIAASEPGSEAAVAALSDKLKIVGIMEKELQLENLIKARGFEDVAITIGTTSNNINVMVTGIELKKDEVAIIYNIIKSEVNTSAEFVKIIPV